MDVTSNGNCGTLKPRALGLLNQCTCWPKFRKCSRTPALSWETGYVLVNLCVHLQLSEGKQASQKSTSANSEENEEEVQNSIDSDHHYQYLNQHSMVA